VKFFVRILEAVSREIHVLYSCFFVLSNGTMVSKKSDCVICMGLKVLRREASELKRVRSE
jgi:hypothetical protein